MKIRENESFRYSFSSRPDVKHLIDEHYNSSAEELAKVLLEKVLDCKSVEVSLLCGPSIIIEKDLMPTSSDDN